MAPLFDRARFREHFSGPQLVQARRLLQRVVSRRRDRFQSRDLLFKSLAGDWSGVFNTSIRRTPEQLPVGLRTGFVVAPRQVSVRPGLRVCGAAGAAALAAAGGGFRRRGLRGMTVIARSRFNHHVNATIVFLDNRQRPPAACNNACNSASTNRCCLFGSRTWPSGGPM